MKSERRRVVVIGASAAGLRCACRLARLQPDGDITVVEARNEFSVAACGLPYVLSGDIDDPKALLQTDDGTLRDEAYFANVKGIKVMGGWRATAIDPEARTARIQRGDERKELVWDELVLATGARARRLPGQPDHPLVRAFHTLEDLAPLHDGLAHGSIRRVVVVGAGLVGCELAEAFTAMWGAEVVLVEAAPRPLPTILDGEVAGIVRQELTRNEVRILTGSPVERIETSDKQVEVIAGGESLVADVAIVSIGVDPATELAREAGVSLGPTGAIVVDHRLSTSIPHVWAAGDCIQLSSALGDDPVTLPLGSLANRQGRTLANILAGREDLFPSVCGAATAKVFDCNVASVGLTRDRALAAGHQARCAWVHAHASAHYWPESKEIALQMVYDSDTRRVLGIQAAGDGEVAKRVDVATQLIAGQATIESFAHLEHAYAPPYAPAIDPLAVLAFAASNQEDGVEACSPLESLEGRNVLDVRQPGESESRPVPGGQVKAIPLEEVRSRFGEIEPDGILVVCERGTRSAEVVRWLTSKGHPCKYLGGGLRWRELAEESK
jgi:NADPH-dependent 2,4-dienoyl-CoA reductase/sulfur reductase-like enzyme/rhodanese-related sulfurtransferase